MTRRILPALDYPPPGQHGYWAPVTSTINWCEEDYYATIYSAEIVNTLTNLLFVYLGLKGIINCVKHGHDRIFIISFAGYLLVGLGSFAFHATLKYPWQLVDELSMIYTTCIMNYATFSHNRSASYSTALALGLAGLAAFITVYYHYIQNPTFHQNCYAALTATVLLRAMYIMEVNLRPSLRKKYGTIPVTPSAERSAEDIYKERASNETRDKAVLREMWWLIVLGIGIFLGGFGIWNLDNAYCSQLRTWRRQIGLPWGILLEGHGVWHIMTGIGAYFYLVWGVWLRHALNERLDEFELNWPSKIFSLPEIVRSKKGFPVPGANGFNLYRNGAGNGTGKLNGNGRLNGRDKKTR